MNSSIAQDRGFTLIELLLVSVLLALLSAILYSTINGIIRGSSLIEEQRVMTRTGQFVLERMTRELSARALIALNSEKSNSEAPGNPFGIQPRHAMIGIDKKLGHSQADIIRFVSTTSGQAGQGAVQNFGLLEVQYALGEMDDSYLPNLKAHADKDRYVLLRREAPANVQNQELLKQRTYTIPLAENVVGLNFRYMKDGAWQEQWQDPGLRLPEAVEITLRLASETSEQTALFRTAVLISRPNR